MSRPSLALFALIVSACSQRQEPPTPRRADQPRAMLSGITENSTDPVGQVSDHLAHDVLYPALDALEPQLAEVMPPPASPSSVQRAASMANQTAIALIRMVGRRDLDAMSDDLGVIAESALDRIDHIGSGQTALTGDQSIQAMPGATLLEEFLERQRIMVGARLHDLNSVLRLARITAEHDAPQDLEIDARLRAAVNVEALRAWFVREVTIQWMNLCTQVSLGSRAAGHGGMIDITIDVSFDTDGAQLRFVGARNEAGPGAAAVLRDARDDHGTPYTLATLPVYRRVWLKTSDSRLDTVPAFVITPEGAIEAQLDDDALAAIGAGRQGAELPEADATIGAKLIFSMLRGVGTQVLQ